MHKVLKKTELPNLRALGIEVFNPPYISPVYDQSADLTHDFDQPTTLPKEVFTKLMKYDFFYKPIAPEIAEILNSYFDTIIVTINADWLKAICDIFNGRIVFRIYGQHFPLSEKIIEIGLFPTFLDRDNLFIVPFAHETVETEHGWFADRVFEIVPYQIPDDVFDCGFHWGQYGLRSQIATSIPNIQNPYFAQAYARFAASFPESIFRIYGPQRAAPKDPRIVGELPRQDFLERLTSSSGYYYNYDDNVCYLPPIEMMQLGGPVVCAQGSLLAKFLGTRSPNVAATPDDAKSKLKRLISGDAGWSSELIAAQEATRARYDRGLVEVAFKNVFSRLLELERDAPFATDRIELRLKTPKSTIRYSIAILLHLDGLFGWVDGVAYAFEGIPRVVDAIVKAIADTPGAGCVLTTTKSSFPLLVDFFAEHLRTERVRIRVMPPVDAADQIGYLKAKLALMVDLDEDPVIDRILVPHYYAFPEALIIKNKAITLYLPDYFPYLFPGVVFDQTVEKDAENKRVGVALAVKAQFILTNSEFTRGYLPKAGFVNQEEPDKVIVAPLPFLGAGRAAELNRSEKDLLFRRIGSRPFIFYPTANRPNKQIDFLLDIFARLKLRYPPIKLVLTCSLSSVHAAAEAAARLGFGDELVLVPRCSEGVLHWLYSHCEALCLTSTMEGNFPPQMLEALKYGAPIVATRLPTVTELLGDQSELLHLCRPLDIDDFVAKLCSAIDHREVTLDRQTEVATLLSKWNSSENFAARLGHVFPQLKGEYGALLEVN